MTEQVVIIGGGITGLSAAFYLQKQIREKQLPLKITLIEGNDRLGGKIETEKRDGFVIERGPDSFLERKTSAGQLAKDVGLGNELVNNATGQSYVLVKDKLHPIPEGSVMGIPTNIGPFVTSGLFSFPGKMRAAADFVLPAHEVNGDQSLGKFFRRRFGNEIVENLIEPLLSGIYAGDIDDLSLMATFPQFYQLEQKHRSLVLGLKKMQTMKKNDKHSPKKGIFQTLKSGLSSLVEEIEKQLTDVTIQKNTTVKTIQKQGNQSIITLSDGGSIIADHIISTVPHYLLTNMIDSISSISYFDKMPATSVATVAMAFPKDRIQGLMNGTGFVIARNAKYSITANTWTHKKWPHTTPEGKVLLRAYVGKPGAEGIVDKSDEEIVNEVLDNLGRIIKLTGEPDFSIVTRLKESMPQYLVGHKENLEKIELEMSKQYPEIILAGASFKGLGIPDCIDQGKEAVEKVVNRVLQPV
ncbi:protoporphyrinogen oxidase [Bacillus carboniphilus]|uniref:Coproporphyrinogen III oxidase n=1 Tax=Bacillus carboniphilus TaxID=86663 RepID=A0ABY9JWI9_9BACI|nr:protoporphyrinogen oxidase [Bacillus carboniphilus]WLR42857.1 protoporphyrinogen oxidase [Bacillus carboniphilus]